MANTLESVTLVNDGDWHSVSELTGGAIAAGTGCLIQIQSTLPIRSAISVGKPVASFKGWAVPPEPSNPLIVDAGENEVWLKGFAILSIQEA